MIVKGNAQKFNTLLIVALSCPALTKIWANLVATGTFGRLPVDINQFICKLFLLYALLCHHLFTLSIRHNVTRLNFKHFIYTYFLCTFPMIVCITRSSFICALISS